MKILHFSGRPALLRLTGTCVAVGLIGIGTGARAQLAPPAAAPDGLAALPADQGPVATGQRRFSIEPRFQSDVMWTNNVAAGSGGKTSDFVTTVRPGIRLTARGDRLKGDLDYSLSRILYARTEGRDQTQNALRASANLEAIENFGFLDVSSTISQQTISAFGPQTVSNDTYNPNRTEVATYSLSPYVRGRLGDWASYQLRYSRQSSRPKSSVAPGQDLDDYQATLNGESERRAVRWTATASSQSINYSTGVHYQADRVRAVLAYLVTPQVSLALVPGYEANNYVSGERQGSTTYGVRADWTLSTRGKASATWEKRFFGNAYQFSFENRTPLTAWRYSESRDVNATPNMSGQLSLGPLYDLLFFQFESIEPDPTRRARLVESYMVANGQDRNAVVQTGFLASAATQQRRRDLSFTLIGRRSTLSVLGTQSQSSRLSQFVTEQDDLSSSSVVRQRGLSLVLSHRLTPETSISATALQTWTSGDLATQRSTLRGLNLSLSTRLGKHMSGSIGLRRTIFDTDLAPYGESAVLGGLSVQF